MELAGLARSRRIAVARLAPARPTGPRTLSREHTSGCWRMIARGRACTTTTLRDPDLDLLLGDQRYASGLARLAALGDLEATAELADLISRVAQAHAAGDADAGRGGLGGGQGRDRLGPSEAHEAAKQLARMGAPGARQALLSAAARQRSAER